MKITLVCSGGVVGGRPRRCELDASQLDQAGMTGLRALLDLCAEKESVRLESEDGKYSPQYRLEIEREGKVTEISFDEMAMPPGAESLIGYLSERARPMDL